MHIGAGHDPNGDVSAISRLSDLVDGDASGSSWVGEGADSSALRVVLLYQSSLDVRSAATENPPAQDIAAVCCLLGGDPQAIVPRCTARASDFFLPLWTTGRVEFEEPIFQEAVRRVGQA